MPYPYKNIPVDTETYKRVGEIAQTLGFGKRGYAAVIRTLLTAYDKSNSTFELKIEKLEAQPASSSEN
jgi:hypothetical protein